MLPLIGSLVGGLASIFGNQSANSAIQGGLNKAAGVEKGLFNQYSQPFNKITDMLTGTPAQNEMWRKTNKQGQVMNRQLPFGAGGNALKAGGWKEINPGVAGNPGFGGMMRQATSPGSAMYNELFQPIDPNNVQNTPGYQFTLGQGLESTQNSFAAQGLGSSGAAMKGAAQYATGLANNTWQQQFQSQMQNRQQLWNQLFGGTQLATGAQENLLGNANYLGSNLGNLAVAGAQSQAGSNVATGNTLANLFSGAGIFGSPAGQQAYGYSGNLFGGA